MKNQKKIDWIVHLVGNGICGDCGHEERSFLPYACNAHTHGMEKYGHPDFQLVLAYLPEEICRVLNTMGLRVQAGERFQAGDMVRGIYEDCDVRLDEAREDGRSVLRIVVPDKYNRFPEEEGCMDVYRIQLLETDALRHGAGKRAMSRQRKQKMHGKMIWTNVTGSRSSA